MKSGQIPDAVRTYIQNRLSNQSSMGSNPSGIGVFGGQNQNQLGGGGGGLVGNMNNQYGNQNKSGGLFGGLGASSSGGLGLGGQTTGVLGLGNQQNNQLQGVKIFLIINIGEK